MFFFFRKGSFVDLEIGYTMNKQLHSIHKLLFIFLIIGAQIPNGFTQKHQPPIPVEIMLGQEAIFSQVVLNRGFTPTSKFSFFNLSTYSASLRNEDHNELAIINQVNYALGKGFEVMAGVNMNSEVGLAPLIGPKHVFATRQFLAVSIFSYFLNGDHDVSFFGIYEYKPPLTDKLSLYLRAQVLLEQSLGEEQHNRSFLYTRVGLKSGKLNFGAGANLDQFGPQREFRDNYGVFLGWDF